MNMRNRENRILAMIAVALIFATIFNLAQCVERITQ